MPLDYATFVPSVGNRDQFIAGVRGGYIHKFDPATGAKITTARFFPTAWPPSVVTYNAVNDKIYASYSTEWTPLQPVSVPVLKRFLLEINPADLSITSTIDITKATAIFTNQLDGPRQGATDLLAGADGIVYTGNQAMANALSNSVGMGRVDPGNTAAQTLSHGDSFCSFVQIARDDDTGNMWCTDESGPAVIADTPNAVGLWTSVFAGGSYAFFAKVVGFSNQSVHIPAGICYDQPRKIMWVTGRPLNSGNVDNTLHSVVIPVPTNIVPDANSNIEDPNPLPGIVDLGTTSQPFRIRYRSTTQRLYIPIMQDNSIVIVNPATNSVESVRAGFDSPIDVCITPNKVFAVQQGSVGLVAIP